MKRGGGKGGQNLPPPAPCVLVWLLPGFAPHSRSDTRAAPPWMGGRPRCVCAKLEIRESEKRRRRGRKRQRKRTREKRVRDQARWSLL